MCLELMLWATLVWVVRVHYLTVNKVSSWSAINQKKTIVDVWSCSFQHPFWLILLINYNEHHKWRRRNVTIQLHMLHQQIIFILNLSFTKSKLFPGTFSFASQTGFRKQRLFACHSSINNGRIFWAGVSGTKRYEIRRPLSAVNPRLISVDPLVVDNRLLVRSQTIFGSHSAIGSPTTP